MGEGGFSSFINSRGLAIFMLILALIVWGFLIANAVYFNKIRTDPNQSSISQSDAKTWMIINIILAILLFFFVLYYGAKSLYTAKAFKTIQAQYEAKANASFEQIGNAYQKNISDPLQQVYQAGVKAGEQAYATASNATDQAAKAAAAAYTAITYPYVVAPVLPTTSGKSDTVLLYHQGGGVYSDPKSGNLYKCNNDQCGKI
jgi:heme/copper-type cytochrome/quinol oxidase subunit 2